MKIAVHTLSTSKRMQIWRKLESLTLNRNRVRDELHYYSSLAEDRKYKLDRAQKELDEVTNLYNFD